MLADGAQDYWRLDESDPATAYNWAGFDDLNLGTGVSRGADGGTGDGDKASTFDGTDNGRAVKATAAQAPSTFTAEAWIKTTTTSGGKIIGFGGNQTGNSGNYDRHVYMQNDGKIVFGTYPGFTATITSAAAYNDGQWHHVVASLSSGGESLYVDGRRVARNAGVTSGQDYAGYWRVGGDNIGGWPGQPASFAFQGQIDDVAIYPTALSLEQVRSHYALSGRTLPGARPADAYGQAVYDADPDAYWRLGETVGTVAADASPNGSDGIYSGGYTQGGQSAVSGGPAGSVGVDGNNGQVSGTEAVSNPQTYSEEPVVPHHHHPGRQGSSASPTPSSGTAAATTATCTCSTTAGCASAPGSASPTWSTPTRAYNDGQWHHVVAEGSPSGLKPVRRRRPQGVEHDRRRAGLHRLLARGWRLHLGRQQLELLPRRHRRGGDLLLDAERRAGAAALDGRQGAGREHGAHRLVHQARRPT
nr:LamG domain-containing protein [Angustibacter aerolatus]